MKSTQTDDLWRPDNTSYQPAALGQAGAPNNGIKRKRLFATILVLLALLATASFLLVDFRVLSGGFTSTRQVTTTTAGIDAGHPLPLEAEMDLYVLGRGSVAGELAEKLANGLEASRYVGPVHLRLEPLQPGAGGLLAVEVTEQSLLWTPLYSHADLTMRMAYASDGQVEWDNTQGVVSLAGDQPVAHVQGGCQVHDSTSGLMSLPGYRGYLSETLAAEISQLLETSLSATDR